VTLISSIITDAYREANIVRIGSVPDAAKVTEALRLYNGLLAAIYGGDAGESLSDWPLGTYGADTTNFTLPYDAYAIVRPQVNRRLIATATEAKTVYLSPTPQDGSRMGIIDPFSRLAAFPVTLDANGRTIEGTPTLVLNVNATNRQWFYRADLGQWVKLTSVAETDQNPFPDPRNGRTMDDQSLAIFKQAKRSFVADYLQELPLEIDDSLSWPFMSTQGFDTQRAYGSSRAFNRGWYS
jgi:hypothetical protein